MLYMLHVFQRIRSFNNIVPAASVLVICLFIYFSFLFLVDYYTIN